MLQKTFVNLNKGGEVGGEVSWSLMTELNQVFLKKGKRYRKSNRRPWQMIGLWGRRGRRRQN